MTAIKAWQQEVPTCGYLLCLRKGFSEGVY
jgi:hypothetical protein